MLRMTNRAQIAQILTLTSHSSIWPVSNTQVFVFCFLFLILHGFRSASITKKGAGGTREVESWQNQEAAASSCSKNTNTKEEQEEEATKSCKQQLLLKWLAWKLL